MKEYPRMMKLAKRHHLALAIAVADLSLCASGEAQEANPGKSTKLPPGAALGNSTSGEAARETVGLEVVQKELEYTPQDFYVQHIQVYLKLEHGPTKIPLARVYVADDEEYPNWPDLGFDPTSLEADWLKRDELLQVTWCTCSQGSGHYIADSVLLLRREDTGWKELFRHSGHGIDRCGWTHLSETRWCFVYDEDSGQLRFERHEGGEDYFDEPRALAVPREMSGKTYFYRRTAETTRWPCEITEQGVTLLPGLCCFDLGEETFPFEEIAQVEAARRDQSPTSDEEAAAVVEDLRRLNPAFTETGKCTGKVVVNDAVPPLVPCTKTRYSSS